MRGSCYGVANRQTETPCVKTVAYNWSQRYLLKYNVLYRGKNSTDGSHEDMNGSYNQSTKGMA